MTTPKITPAKKETRTLLDMMSGPAAVPKGSRVKITAIGKADQEYIPLSPGDEGVVVGGNEVQLWVEFDKGVSVTLLPGVDHYEVTAAPVVAAGRRRKAS